MRIGSKLPGMRTDRVTVTLDSATLTVAKERARLAGMSLSAWIDRAAKERAIREDFEAHAAALRSAGWPNVRAGEEQAAYLDALDRVANAPR